MSYTVMLVDNEPAIPQGLIRLIDWNSCGCHVTSIACDGADAVCQMREVPVDIVVSDIRMPEMDGLELCAWIRRNRPQTQIILLTGYPDFEYAQQAIQYQVVDFVLKPTTEAALTSAVEKACVQLQKESNRSDDRKSLQLEQQMLLSELVFHSHHSLLYTVNRLNELHLTLTSYFVLCLSLLMKSSASPAEDDLLARSQAILRDCCGKHPLYVVPKSDDCCYVILCLPQGDDVYALCSSAAETCDRETDFLLTIGISRRHQDPLDLKLAAQEADDAQRFTLYPSQPSVMRCEDLPPLSEEAVRTVLEKLQLLESALENRSQDAVNRQQEAFLECLMTQEMPFSTIYQVSQLLYNFCVSLLMSCDSSVEISQTVTALQGDTPAKLEQELRCLTARTLTEISRTPGNIDSIIYDVKQYIDQNYAQALSLDTLAAQVHLSSSYLSKLFKREMGENLSTYILNTRIDQARLLLRTTDKKAYEIAEAVGIYDPVYFSKIFKKVTGLKPREYRENPEKENGKDL